MRPPEPSVLGRGGAAWTAAYTALPPPRRFAWPTVDGRTVREHLLNDLRAMTQGHCSYCDGFPLDSTAIETIDHFQPKARWPELAFAWGNLYLACPRCQQRLDAYDHRLLRPDDEGHSFERYFLYDERTGEIRPNPSADTDDQARATITCELFRLNADGRTEDRRRTLKKFRGLGPELRRELLWEFAFVFLLEHEV